MRTSGPLLASSPTVALLRRPSVRRWAAADLLSVTGSWMQGVALSWLVLQRTGSTAALGLTLTVAAAPSLVLGLWGGALADRLDARRVLPWTQGFAGALAALLTVLAATGRAGVPAVWALAVVGGLVRVVEGPLLGRYGAQLFGRRDLAAGLALGAATESTGRVVGMALAGVVVAAVGPAAVFGLNALSYGAVVLALLRIAPDQLHPLERSAPERAGVRPGLRYLAGHPELLVTFGLALALGTFGRNFQVTMAAMARGPLHTGPAGYGLFSTAFALGALSGALLATRLRPRTLPVLLGAGALAGLLQAASGASPTPTVFLAVMVPVAGCAVVLDTAVQARVHLRSAGELRGRVLAVHGLVGAAAGAMGGPLLGWVCDALGPRAALAMGGSVAVLACAVAAVVFARLRRAPVRSLVQARVLLRRPLQPARAREALAA
ncbi:MAG TPA: MFS transporter [Motilibacteraceae bacterium]|nr:MFS transporter [Motilibacteraceae bacterium]